jgi:hypothetical protein
MESLGFIVHSRTTHPLIYPSNKPRALAQQNQCWGEQEEMQQRAALLSQPTPTQASNNQLLAQQAQHLRERQGLLPQPLQSYRQNHCQPTCDHLPLPPPSPPNNTGTLQSSTSSTIHQPAPQLPALTSPLLDHLQLCAHAANNDPVSPNLPIWRPHAPSPDVLDNSGRRHRI